MPKSTHLSLFSQYRQHQLEALLEITRIFATSNDLPALLRTILGYAADMVRADFGYIALATPEETFRITTGYRLPTQVFETLSPYLAQKRPPRELWAEKQLRQQLHLVNQAVTTAMEQVVALPMTLKDDETAGGIFLFRTGRLAFTASDRALLQDFAAQAAVAVRNARQLEQLRNEKARVEAIIENNPNGIMILAPDLRITAINRALSNLLGLTREQAMGRHCAQVLRLENRSGEHLCLSQSTPPPPTHPLHGEGEILRPSQKPIVVSVSYSPLFGGDGHLVNIIITFVDISRYREAENLKSTFISVISHELKTPVSLIKGYGGTLMRTDVTPDPDFVRESAQIIVEEADRLTELIDNLLEASRIQTGTLSLTLKPLDVAEVARKGVERIGAQTDKHQIVLDFPKERPLVLADERRLRQVFDNLLNNAVKYAPDGGIITVGARVQEEKMLIFVRDQGIGIPKAQQQVIFESFYRVDSSLRRSTQGAGLGLFLVRAIVRAMAGDVWVESEAGQGATFYFTLPLA
jgi:PAS domain S-box-containing protein